VRRLPLAVLSFAAALATVAATGAAPASGAVPGPSTRAASALSSSHAKDRFALGDSVMLGAKRDLKGLGFAIVDAVESRQAYAGPGLIKQHGGNLPTNVVVHLGTNGTFPLSVCKKIVDTVGPNHRVFFVTIHVPRSWQKGNNKVIRECDAAFADDRVHVIDWNGLANAHPKWLYHDRTHLKPAGARAFADLINSSVDQAVKAAHRKAVGSAGGSGSAGTVTP